MPTLEELEADAQQRSLEAIYGPTPQDRERIGFPNFGYPGQPGYARQPEPAPQQPPVQSFMAGGPQATWLAGLTGLGRMAPPVPAPQIPATLGLAPSAQPEPGRIAPIVPPPPRLAMPTQETHTEAPWNDERVNPPTVPERQGLEGSIAERHWNVDDPVSLLGMRRGAIDWTRGLSRDSSREPDVTAEYVRPEAPESWLRAQGGGRADTVRFRTPEQAVSRIVVSGPADNPTYSMRREAGTASTPEFTDIGRHELRHRGFAHLERLARVYGINFPEALRRAPYQTEGANVFEDRRTGFPGSYRDMTFDAAGTRAAERDLGMAREVARQILAERVRRLHATPGATWSDIE